jgi:hypothetical protein
MMINFPNLWNKELLPDQHLSKAFDVQLGMGFTMADGYP